MTPAARSSILTLLTSIQSGPRTSSSHEESELMAHLGVSRRRSSTLLTSYDLHLFNEGNHNRLLREVRRAPHRGRRPAGHLLCGVGAGCRAHLGGWRLQRLESRLASHEPARELRRVGGVRPRARQGRGVQVPHPLALSHVHGGQGRPLRLLQRGAAAHGVDRVGPGLRVARLPSGCARATTATSSTRPCRSTRCIWARGCACRKRATAR